MTSTQQEATAREPPVPAMLLRWMIGSSLDLLSNLFGSISNSLITLAILALGAWMTWPLVHWAILDASWTGNARDCAARTGACWSFIGAKLRFLLFAFYPSEQNWRPAVALLLTIILVITTARPRFWSPYLVILWIAVLVVVLTLMSGASILTPVPSDQWGGLTLTLMITVGGFAGAFPLALLLALARRSAMGGMRLIATVYIEVMRGIPMIAVLYVAMLLVPMMLPEHLSLAKLFRAEIALTLFFAAYLAEILRAGLQAIPTGQYEGAKALGLGYWRMMQLIILPQAIRTVIPAMVGLAIGILQNTSLVAVIGIFDMLNAARSAAMDPAWLGFYDEAFLFVGFIYFCCCFGASRYSLWLERYLRRSKAGHRQTA